MVYAIPYDGEWRDITVEPVVEHGAGRGGERAMEGIALVVFDMAGTTIEDAGQVPEAFATALATYGLSVTDDELRAVRGASKREAIRLLVERQRPALLPQCAAIFEAFRDQ